MSIPDYQTLMLPALRALSDGREHPPREVIAVLADEHALTDEEREQRLPKRANPSLEQPCALGGDVSTARRIGGQATSRRLADY